MKNQFSQRVTDIITYSKEEAYRLQNDYIGAEHLLLGLIREGEGKAIDILNALHVNLAEVKRSIEELLKLHSKVNENTTNEDINFNEQASRVLKLCILESKLLNSEIADSEHILLAIMKLDKNDARNLLETYGVTYQNVYDQLSLKPDVHNGLGFSEDEDDDDENMPHSNINGPMGTQQQTRIHQPKNDTPALDAFGTDLTRMAEEGKLDPVIGRDKEIERVAQILTRRKKNNPVLIGEPGVGKSAIVEGLALRIVQRKVSRILFDKRVVSLDLAAVVAGTKYRGQFEERLRSILAELKKNTNIILFIDEIHTIIGAGSAAGSMDAANMLKPSLSRGEIQCIGATTLDEYRQSIEKDRALERRFQKIIVEPTTPEETLQILEQIKDKYEDHHNVTYTEAALKACVSLTERYINDRFFPDKAIDALDEAGSRVHLINIAAPKELEQQEKRIEQMKVLKNQAVKDQNFELAANYRDKEKTLGLQLDALRDQWEQQMKENRQIVDESQIEDIVSQMSGVPIQRMVQSEGKRLLTMKSDLKSKVIGQDKAIDVLVKAIQRNRLGLKEPNRPIGTFMFVGPTGVGKTYLAQQLALLMFGSKDAVIRVDMSEYMQDFNVSRLIGAPPGYVGFEEGGQLTEKVRRKPYSIILLDEIEKAHQNVYNILLQVMDEGRLTDGQGRTIDFKNTIIIMTSNVGSRELKEFGKGIGFTAGTEQTMESYSNSIIDKALHKRFAPEFLNRLDEVINFEQLNMDSLIKIIDIELKGLVDRIDKIGYHFVIDDEAKKFVAEKGYDVEYGARPLKRAIQKYIEDELSEFILNSELTSGDTILATYDKDKNKLVMSIK
ncbi:MAG: ATP-dependent Clp protease ATP-binding subunit [Phocaeicola sp.]|uniref:ATP-dependent Clp protease ATP-binding subunit n=1 Tax=Phocaeicola TaxID=909656 RepID=UPI00234E3F93|nr:ATP-dependent Clp protease ATP-binding subunit [Phocaeicola oris]MCE2615525.1 ATP-dependent Clp protease ATP-binding subunit [Phocaeicola oris]